jgi:hypothetical protein
MVTLPVYYSLPDNSNSNIATVQTSEVEGTLMLPTYTKE